MAEAVVSGQIEIKEKAPFVEDIDIKIKAAIGEKLFTKLEMESYKDRFGNRKEKPKRDEKGRVIVSLNSGKTVVFNDGNIKIPSWDKDARLKAYNMIKKKVIINPLIESFKKYQLRNNLYKILFDSTPRTGIDGVLKTFYGNFENDYFNYLSKVYLSSSNLETQILFTTTDFDKNLSILNEELDSWIANATAGEFKKIYIIDVENICHTEHTSKTQNICKKIRKFDNTFLIMVYKNINSLIKALNMVKKDNNPYDNYAYASIQVNSFRFNLHGGTRDEFDLEPVDGRVSIHSSLKGSLTPDKIKRLIELRHDSYCVDDLLMIYIQKYFTDKVGMDIHIVTDDTRLRLNNPIFTLPFSINTVYKNKKGDYRLKNIILDFATNTPDLFTGSIPVYHTTGETYRKQIYQKYLKYKSKYLQLKNIFNKN
jgi:hypothetical protein